MRQIPEPSPRRTVARVLTPHPCGSPPPAPSPRFGFARRLALAVGALWLSALGRRSEPAAQAAPAMSAGSGPWTSVDIHTDGSFHPQGGRMGWGAVITSGSSRRGRFEVLSLLAGGARGGTAAQAEANAIAEALESLPDATRRVFLRTDCQSILAALRLAIDPREHGAPRARAGLDRATFERVRAAAAGRDVRLLWVKGHDGAALNEAADILATFGSGGAIPIHPLHLAWHPRARAAAIARLIEPPAPPAKPSRKRRRKRYPRIA